MDFYTSSGLPEDNSPTSCVLVLLMTIGVVFLVLPLECLYPSFYI
jgi:hypothetical protein